MRRFLIFTSLIFGITILNGCATTKSPAEMVSSMRQKDRQACESFMGKKKHILIKYWGPPHKKSKDGKGGEIYTYTKGAQFYFGYVKNIRHMYINENNIIYHYKSNTLVK